MPQPLRPSLVVIFGPPGTVKSSSELTWPGKVEVFDFDDGLYRAKGYDEMLDSGQLIVHSMLPPAKSLTKVFHRLEGFNELWDEFTQKFYIACENLEVHTIVIDTLTICWTLAQDGHLQSLQETQLRRNKDAQLRKQLQQIEFRDPNRRLFSIISEAKSHGKWLIFTMHETDEYVPLIVNGVPQVDDSNNVVSTPSGRRVPDGFKYSVGQADWVFYTKLIPGAKSTDMPTQSAEIQKSALGLEMLGRTVSPLTYGQFYFQLANMGKVPEIAGG